MIEMGVIVMLTGIVIWQRSALIEVYQERDDLNYRLRHRIHE